MLSYRHNYHAGNFADVLKHIVQTHILEALLIKPKPFVYYDTHAGAGRYDLMAEKSQKTAEFKDGIAKLWNQPHIPTILGACPRIDNLLQKSWICAIFRFFSANSGAILLRKPENSPKSIFPSLRFLFSDKLLEPYRRVIKQLNPNGKLKFYPGSPLLAHILLPRTCRLELSELHPSDFALLEQEFTGKRNVAIVQADGFKSLLAKVPPIQRRGLILIDPPYELKTEYSDVLQAVKKAYKKFATGIFAIWYPVLSRQQAEKFCSQFKQSSIKKILRIELCVKSDDNAYGMTGSGMIVINPPWKLAEQMQQILPYLKQVLAQDSHAKFQCYLLN